MSKINDLIKELCPNGVEKVSLGSLMTRKKEKNFENSGVETVYSVTKENGIVKSDDLHDFNVYSSDLSNYYILRFNQYAYNPARLNIGSIARLRNDEPGLVSPMYIVFELDSSRIDYEYYEHLLFSDKVFNEMCSFVEQGARFRFDYKNWEKVIIDLPPLQVQKEIVRILNKFRDLDNKLLLELDARKSQFEFWRENLFSKSNNMVSVGEMCDVLTGGEPPEDTIKGLESDDEHPYPVYGNGKEIYGYSSSYRVDKDSTVISSIGANTGAIYYRQAFFTPIIRLKVVVPKSDNLLPRYLYYALQTSKFKSKSGSVPNLNANDIKSIRFPLVSIEEQNRIVNILDKFEKLINDITVGLPAEIELRRKQYEYYRNKLLGFEELSVSE